MTTLLAVTVLILSTLARLYLLGVELALAGVMLAIVFGACGVTSHRRSRRARARP
jgi:hypothetical protein